MVSKILRLTLLSNQTVFFTLLFSQNKNFNILRTKRAFNVKQKAFLVIFVGLSISKNCLRSESALSNGSKQHLNKRHCVKSVHVRCYSGPYSVRMRENTDQNNSEYGDFLRSDWFNNCDSIPVSFSSNICVSIVPRWWAPN